MNIVEKSRVPGGWSQTVDGKKVMVMEDLLPGAGVVTLPMNKHSHYFEIYNKYFSFFRGREVHILEIGIAGGGSLQMWRNYFGKHSFVYGVDIAKSPAYDDKRIKTFKGDQGDRKFLQALAREIPRIDILIDDGGHEMHQQIATLEVLFPHISEGGIYLCEDTHTSYWKKWGGGYRKPGTFMEYTKNFVDEVNSIHFKPKDRWSYFANNVNSITFYDSVVVIEKRKKVDPCKACLRNFSRYT